MSTSSTAFMQAIQSERCSLQSYTTTEFFSDARELEIFDGPVITFEVGSCPVVLFMIHERLATRYLKAEVEVNTHPQTGNVSMLCRLRTIDPEAFRRVRNFLYTADFEVFSEGETDVRYRPSIPESSRANDDTESVTTESSTQAQSISEDVADYPDTSLSSAMSEIGEEINSLKESDDKERADLTLHLARLRY
ncbi:unnamed protein product, partial [Fusarium langsethiae]